jgi:hypothetical protein
LAATPTTTIKLATRAATTTELAECAALTATELA